MEIVSVAWAMLNLKQETVANKHHRPQSSIGGGIQGKKQVIGDAHRMTFVRASRAKRGPPRIARIRGLGVHLTGIMARLLRRRWGRYEL